MTHTFMFLSGILIYQTTTLDHSMSSQPQRTILLDSSGTLHPCFHGYPSRMAELDGEQVEVAALYGYLQYTLRVMKEFQYERLIHVLDPVGGSKFRFDLYPEYKANRPPTDPRLTRQKDLLPQLLEAVGHTHIQMDGVESDDVIACLSKQAREEGHVVLILSQDKDLLQLVDDTGVTVAHYIQGSDGFGKLHKFYREADVIQTLGVRPNQVADYLAIVGDSSDNIPGASDAGPKTAARWLQQYGNLSTILMHANEIKGRGSKGLRQDIDKMPLYQKLTTVLHDVEGACFPAATETSRELCESALTILNAPTDWMDRFGFPTQPGFAPRSPRP